DDKHGMQDLNTLPGNASSAAYAVNDADQVTGDLYVGGLPHAFLYSPGNGLQDLGTLPGDTLSAGRGIHTLGKVVGRSQRVMQPGRAGLFSDNQVIELNTVIPPDSGVTLTAAQGINDQGQIVALGYDRQGRIVSCVLTPDGGGSLLSRTKFSFSGAG